MAAGRAARWLLLVAVLFVQPAEGKRRAVDPRDPTPPPHDVFSAAEPEAVKTIHLALDLTVDFETQRVLGSATHTIANLAASERFVVDTRNLEITAVTVDGEPAAWFLGASSRIGRPLVIEIGSATTEVRIDYVTSPESQALFWLDALQTIGGVEPFLFTLAQPDRTREWIPLQDTPGVRMTYDATLRVPPGLLALMSARNATAPSPDGVYRIEMPYPIPAYLIALAVGRLEFHPLGARTGFYSEPELAADASWDLQYLPEMLEVAERMMGPYPFERYDILLAPPGFYAGGMENPMLNFLSARGVSPGNGESSPMPPDVLAHELVHSWAGDLVTCGTWSDTWLNEGFATYYSKRILEEMVSPERSEIGYYWDRQSYESYLEQNKDNPRHTTLHRRFGPFERPSIFTPTNYNKGSIFLKTLEDRIGRETFDVIMRAWFRRYALRWVDDRAFLDELARWGVDAGALQVEEWIYGSGLPSNVTAPERSALWDRIGVEAERFRSGVAASNLHTVGWRHFELALFLWQITDVIVPRMAELDAVFNLSEMTTPSIHWLLAMASTRYAPGLPMFERYLLTGGPNVVSLYQRMVETPEGRAYALAFYEQARPRYDDNTRSHVDRILGLDEAALPAAA